MGKERASLHRGKSGSATHNEHDYMNDKDVTVHGCADGVSLKESELEFYRERYSEMLTEQNEKYIAKRNYDRCKTMEEFYESKRYKPTEEITQWGNCKSDKLPSKEEYEQMTAEYIEKKREWAREHGDHIHVLDYANHYDEATPHTHEREVIDYEDENGVIRVGQEEGLRQSGIELPDPTKPVGRYNNRGMVYTAMCRDMWYDVCEAHGYEVEREPQPRRRKHETVDEFQSRMDRDAQNRAESSLKAQEDVLRQKAEDLSVERQKLEIEAKNERERLEREYQERNKKLNARQRQIELDEARNAIDTKEIDKRYDEMLQFYGKFKNDKIRAHSSQLEQRKAVNAESIRRAQQTGNRVHSNDDTRQLGE